MSGSTSFFSPALAAVTPSWYSGSAAGPDSVSVRRIRPWASTAFSAARARGSSVRTTTSWMASRAART
ncbi:hypothetical protein, partial [Nocardia farcinica]|uniref:hypothetical protein n=1 Tax=Nocardia farcinica TaxID=37329 RepID=UPI002454A2AC